MTYKNLLNQKFGRLTVIKREPSSKYGKSRWLCICECGNQVIVRSSDLISGRTKSCKCLSADNNRERARIHNAKQPPYMCLYKKLKARCNNRHIPLELTYEEFVEFTKTKECHYCGTEVEWVSHHTTLVQPSAVNLDRIDSSKGYSKSNCNVCCYECNIMKNSMPVDIFINRIRTILSRYDR